MGISTESECDLLGGWAFNNNIDLVIVGPEVPLRHGIVDTLILLGVPVMGPTQRAARIEWSKAWARDFMQRHNIPAPQYKVVTGVQEVRSYLSNPDTLYPLVMKADRLAAGKGAFVVKNAEQGEGALDEMAAAGIVVADDVNAVFVLEEYLEGLEVSALAFCDGTRLSMMPPSCDYKRLLEGDEGALTGGMGAYSPARQVTAELWKEVEQSIMQKALDGMAAEENPFKGVLYAGLMLTTDGPKVLEFNCRFGDPEAQVLLPRLNTPLEEIASAIAAGDLTRAGEISWSEDVTVGVVLASDVYPQGKAAPRTIVGLGDVNEGVLVFHGGTEVAGVVSLQPETASTRKKGSIFKSLFNSEESAKPFPDMDPSVLGSGGRILTVVGRGDTFEAAREAAYTNIARIQYAGGQYRPDIALREVGE